MDTRCRCQKCGREKMVSFAQSVLHGWPYCCEQRMAVKETTAEVETVVAQVLAPFDRLIEQVAQRH